LAGLNEQTINAIAKNVAKRLPGRRNAEKRAKRILVSVKDRPEDLLPDGVLYRLEHGNEL
jgi:hypothetical protein